MADLQELQLQHYTFVKEAFAYLLHKTRGERDCETHFQLFRPYIGDAILVLSHIFRKDYWKTFTRVRENLKETNVFERYCRIIPVKKDERYFYSFLLRISLIFELTMYCFDEGYEHYKTGLKCAADYTEIQFFESSGGWEKIEHIALYIARLGRPLTLIMGKENLTFCEKIENFPAAVDAVRKKFTIEGNLDMLDSKELCCLTKMRDSLKRPQKKDKLGDKRNEKTSEKKEIAMDRLQTPILNAAEDNAKKSNPELEMEIAIRTYFRECYLTLTVSAETPTKHKPQDQDVSLKYEESPPTEDYPVTGFMQEHLSDTNASNFADADQHSKNDKLDKNLIAPEECYNQPTFVVPEEYLDLRGSDNSSICKRLYSTTMCPLSMRKKLDGHLKRILDENIESGNCHIMPSGDIFVRPPASALQSEETLVIFADSSTDDEGDPDIDILLCLFTKIEIDSQEEEIAYSLRPGRIEEKRLSGEPDTEGTVVMEMTASTIPSKFRRRSKRKSTDTISNEALYAKVLIRYYKKYFASFLDRYFKTDFSTVKTYIESANSSVASESSAESCEYVFAVSARIMAKRKVLLDNPEECKPVLGIRFYEDFSLVILPLPVQRSLDSQIEKQNYFVVSDGIYGVGPEGPAAREKIWTILYSGDGKSSSLKLSEAEKNQMSEILSSYEPVLNIFTPVANCFTEKDRKSFKQILDFDLQDILSQEQNS